MVKQDRVIYTRTQGNGKSLGVGRREGQGQGQGVGARGRVRSAHWQGEEGRTPHWRCLLNKFAAGGTAATNTFSRDPGLVKGQEMEEGEGEGRLEGRGNKEEGMGRRVLGL